MTIYKKRPPAEPVFRARQYEGKSAESFLQFLQSGATCTTTNHGYGVLKHEVRAMVGGELVEIKKGEWVVYSEDHDVRVMSDGDFREEFMPASDEGPAFLGDRADIIHVGPRCSATGERS